MNPASLAAVSVVVRAAAVVPVAVVVAAAVAEQHAHRLATHQDKDKPAQILEYMRRHTTKEGQLL
jgi:hypothetical protein